MPLWALIPGPIQKILIWAVIVIVALVGFKFWLMAHDRDLLKDYVQRSKLEAIERQLEVAEDAQTQFAINLAHAKAKNQEIIERHEQEIAAYESILAAQGRSCALSDADIEWLRK